MARQKKLKEEKLSKSDKEDLRVYLTEIIVAGRWLKERQLSFTLYASALEASLLTGEFKSALRGILFSSKCLDEVQVSAIGIFIFFCISTWFNWKSTEQTRIREEALHHKLSPHLIEVIKGSTGQGDYNHFDWNKYVTFLSYVFHIIPVFVLMYLNLIDIRISF